MYDRSYLHKPLAELDKVLEGGRSDTAVAAKTLDVENGFGSDDSSQSSEEAEEVNEQSEISSDDERDLALTKENFVSALFHAHVESGRIHAGKAYVQERLACGRKVSCRYVGVTSEEANIARDVMPDIFCRRCHAALEGFIPPPLAEDELDEI